MSSGTDILGRAGGAYIPPARLRQMQAKITDKSSEAYQRIAWEALKKSIHGLINKVNVSNLSDVVRQLLSENIVRGRGLLVRSLLIAQHASPTFTHVFSALVAVVNSKFPQVGELVLKRLINEFRKAFRRNQKDRCLSSARFLAHLVNQKVVHELIILEMLTLLLEQTTDDSVEVAVSVLKECGAILTRLVPKGVLGIFEHLRRILNEGNCDKRISYMLEVMFQIRRDGWKDHPIVLPELDFIPEDDQITHTTSLLDQVDPEDKLNVFRFDPDFLSNEDKYAQIKASFFDSDNESVDSQGNESDAEADSSGDEENDDDNETKEHGAAMGDADQSSTAIIDQTETNLVHLRRTIYLMLRSSLSADEGAHRLMQLKIKPGEEYEVASMVLDCCAQTRSYESQFGRLAQRLCRMVPVLPAPPPTDGKTGGSVRPDPNLGPGSRYQSKQEATVQQEKSQSNAIPDAAEIEKRSYVAQFERIFAEQYAVIHRLETPKLRNVALFYAHLLFSDSISWGALECIKLNERDTTSSGRIYLKHLFLELCSFMGLGKLQARLRDETLQPFFAGILPRDNPKDTRFAINFFTTIGLGGLTMDLRDHLQTSKSSAEQQLAIAAQPSSPSSLEASAEELSSDEDDVLGRMMKANDNNRNRSPPPDPSRVDEDKRKKDDKDRRGDKKSKSDRKRRHRSRSRSPHKARKDKSDDSRRKSKHEEDRRRNGRDSPKKHDRHSSRKRPNDTPFFNEAPNSPADRSNRYKSRR